MALQGLEPGSATPGQAVSPPGQAVPPPGQAVSPARLAEFNPNPFPSTWSLEVTLLFVKQLFWECKVFERTEVPPVLAMPLCTVQPDSS